VRLTLRKIQLKAPGQRIISSAR